MNDHLEQRVKDIEDLIADIPTIISLRLESMTGSLHEHGARIGLIDRQIATLLRDVRDMRGGLTRQLAHQDTKIAELDSRVTALDAKITALDDKITALGGKFDQLATAVRAALDRLPKT